MSYASNMPSIPTGAPPQNEPEFSKILSIMKKNNSVGLELLSNLENICNTLQYTPNPVDERLGDKTEKDGNSIIDYLYKELNYQSGQLNKLEVLVHKLRGIVGT